MLLLLTVALFAVLAAGQQTCTPSLTSCQFYTCLENIYQCDRRARRADSKYPTQYGRKYCEAFNSITSRVSSLGRQFITNTRLCLQQALARWMRSNPRGSCEDLTNFAFASHPQCYTGHSASICRLSIPEQATVATVVDASDLFSWRTASQATQTAVICARQIGVSTAEAAGRLAGRALSPIRDRIRRTVDGARSTLNDARRYLTPRLPTLPRF